MASPDIEIISQDPYVIEVTSTGVPGPAGPQGDPGEANEFEAKDVSTNYTVLSTDKALRVTGTVTITMLTAVGIGDQFFRIKNVGTGAVTIATTASQTIDGGSTFTLSAGEAIVIRSNGTNWEIW